ncbi:UDP-N-acetylglucosamine 1-carboxyvinyltransferase 1 [Clostridia bacterium]|nr:UDP-N-acetylglucosamine 1-carboxyvinyltransferase 1 [Clostridia bacterium]
MLYKPKIQINGGRKLKGEIKIQGAKNSLLPIAAGAMLCNKGECNLLNAPDISDTYVVAEIINELCGRAFFKDNVLTIKSDVCKSEISDDNSRKIRSSIIFAGAILGRNGECELSMPGGDTIGRRPIDLHLSAFEQMGVRQLDAMGRIYLTAENGLRGATIPLSFPSVGVTENIMLAGCLAKGTTVIKNAAREPEIIDLANFLNKCGAVVQGAGSSTIIIEGVRELTGCDYTIMPDRIVTATYLLAAAVTKGELLLHNSNANDLDAVIFVLGQMGCNVKIYDNKIYIYAPDKLKSINIIQTMPYPGFPTDCQAITMAGLCLADGVSHFYETIFDDRFRHVDSLNRMGANIRIHLDTAIITGVKNLYGARVSTTDLRGGAALVLAALAAKGKTIIEEVHHIDRGYENLEKVLRLVGAEIERV